MPLINCPECQKDISDKAPQCPNCGCPASQWGGKPKEDDIACPKCGSSHVTAHQPKGEVAQITCLKCGFWWIAGTTEKYRQKFQDERDREVARLARIKELEHRAANMSPEERAHERRQANVILFFVFVGLALFITLIIYALVNA